MTEETKALYQRLMGTQCLKGTLGESGGNILWRFHEHLTLAIYVDDRDTYVDVNNGMTHFHPDEEELYDDLMDIMHGETVFVTKLGLFGRYISWAGTKKSFEKYRALLTIGVGVRCVSGGGVVR